MYMWLLFAFGSALFAGLTAILAKCGVRRTDSAVATAVRTVVVLACSWMMVFLTGAQAGLGSVGGRTLLFLVLSGCRRRERETLRKLPAAITLIPVGALVIRLVLTYRIDSVNPSLSMYYVELLALVSLTLGFYRLSSFAFQAGQTRRFSLYAGASAVLCIASLADGSAYLSSMLLLAGGGLTLMGFLLLRVGNEIEADQDDGTIIGY